MSIKLAFPRVEFATMRTLILYVNNFRRFLTDEAIMF